jgi:hypothetical protein
MGGTLTKSRLVVTAASTPAPSGGGKERGGHDAGWLAKHTVGS